MKWNELSSYVVLALFIGGFLVGCGGAATKGSPTETVQVEGAADHADVPEGEGHEQNDEAGELELPVVKPVDLQGSKLRVVATTSIIGDVVAQVGGEAIDLSTLMGTGQDPHSYQPGARELTAVADAHVIFVNGWDLEETLIGDLENIGEAVPLVPVSAHIPPLAFNESDDEHENEAVSGEEHGHGDANPHVWFNVHNVEKWVENITRTLRDLDPDNAEIYENNATAYLAELVELEAYIERNLEAVPSTKRFLVTNHDSFGYFAQAYDFAIVGTVIPGSSTLAEPSANDLTGLISIMREYQVCTIFTETTVRDQLARVVADELNFCNSVQVLSLYTDSLGPAGSGADSYLGLMRTNVDTIAAGLKPD